MKGLLASLAAVAALVLPTSALAGTQTFGVDGNGTFAVHAWMHTGASVDLKQITDARVMIRDRANDVTYSNTLGAAANHGGWLVFTVGATPVDATVAGHNFDLVVRNTANAGHLGAAVKAWGRVTDLKITGTYQIGDLPPRQINDPDTLHQAFLRPNPLTFAGHGQWHGRLSTAVDGASHVTIAGRRFGYVRFIDLSATQDLRVVCTGRGRTVTTTDAQGHHVVVCAGRYGEAKASGSDFRFRTSANRLLVSLDATTQGSFAGIAHGVLIHNAHVGFDPRGFDRIFVSSPLG